MRRNSGTTLSKQGAAANGTPSAQKPSVAKSQASTSITNRPGSARRPSSGIPSAKKPISCNSAKPDLSLKPSTPQKQLKISDRPNSAREAKTDGTQPSLKTIKDANSVDEQMRDFKNLRSQLHQWIYS